VVALVVQPEDHTGLRVDESSIGDVVAILGHSVGPLLDMVAELKTLKTAWSDRTVAAELVLLAPVHYSCTLAVDAVGEAAVRDKIVV
jgi:hypothetical protein